MLRVFLIIFIKILSSNGHSIVVVQNLLPPYYDVFSPCKNGIFKMKISDKNSNSWIGIIDVINDFPVLPSAVVELRLKAEAAVTVNPESGEVTKSDNQTNVLNFLRPDNGYSILEFEVEGQGNGTFPNMLSLTLNSENICKDPQEWDPSMVLTNTGLVNNKDPEESKLSEGIHKSTQMSSETCGKRKIFGQGLITNGDLSKKGDWPWHAALLHKTGTSIKYACGGTLLNTNTIITAAHCVVENENFMIPERILIKLGLHDRLLAGRNVQDFRAYKIIPHEEYDFDRYKNDIALIQLASEAIFTSYVQPICLWPKDQTDLQTVINENGIVVGWGLTEEKHDASETLRQAKMPIIESFTCLDSNRDFFGAVLTGKNYCAGFRNGTSVCNGDSGGGMIFLRDNVYRIRGIVSAGPSKTDENVCNPQEYIVFTDVAKYLNWIENKISQYN